MKWGGFLPGVTPGSQCRGRAQCLGALVWFVLTIHTLGELLGGVLWTPEPQGVPQLPPNASVASHPSQSSLTIFIPSTVRDPQGPGFINVSQGIHGDIPESSGQRDNQERSAPPLPVWDRFVSLRRKFLLLPGDPHWGWTDPSPSADALRPPPHSVHLPQLCLVGSELSGVSRRYLGG